MQKTSKPINHVHNKIDKKDLSKFYIGKLLLMSIKAIPGIAYDVCQLGTNSG